MTRIVLCLVVAAALAVSLPLTIGARQAPAAREALQGLDPVALVRGAEVFGKPAFSITRDGLIYLFASAENKAAFEAEPSAFTPQYGGACARMGGGVTGNPDLFTVHEGRLYLFGSEDCVKTFKAAPARFIKVVPPVPQVSADAARQGLALLDKAADAMGGAARVDRLTALRTVSVRPLSAPPAAGQPPRTLTTTTIVALPDRVWQEATIDGRNSVSVATADGGFRSGFNGTRVLTAPQAEALRELALQHPVLVVRARRAPGVAVWAAGQETVGGVPVDVVGVASGTRRERLYLDRATGRVVAMAYYGRGADGMFGDVMLAYDAFKDVGHGLVLPHAYTTAFDGGGPGPRAEYREMQANPPVDPAIFRAPGRP